FSRDWSSDVCSSDLKLAVERPGPLRGGFQVLRDAVGFARGQARTRRPIVNTGARPAAVMRPLRGRLELANRFGVIVQAIGDESELPLRDAATRPAHLRARNRACGVEISGAHALVNALDRGARGGGVARNRGRSSRERAATASDRAWRARAGAAGAA